MQNKPTIIVIGDFTISLTGDDKTKNLKVRKLYKT